jgi:hypothetical protein
MRALSWGDSSGVLLASKEGLRRSVCWVVGVAMIVVAVGEVGCEMDEGARDTGEDDLPSVRCRLLTEGRTSRAVLRAFHLL